MKKAIPILFVIMVLGFGGIIWVFQNDAPIQPDAVVINDAVMLALQSSEETEMVDLLTDTIIQEQKNMEADRKNRDTKIQIFLYTYIGFVVMAGICLFFYCERSILTPFRKLQRFAREVALGNLDIPLEMDRYGAFGAFTESFDLMREELGKARENERAADRSKKELVASLSHDIKTPVASIKAAVELMLVSIQTLNESQSKRLLEQIGEKAEQINTLITDMFHVTLEELQALSVTLAEIHSTTIHLLLQNADYKRKAKHFNIPDCIVMTDPIRLQQVFDNIIGNSYKYADTDIQINSFFEESYLIIDIMDFGKGVSNDELPLITNKFYRGKNTEDKSGYGLGLYISKHLVTQMSGKLYCENRTEGFAVRITLCLA